MNTGQLHIHSYLYSIIIIHKLKTACVIKDPYKSGKWCLCKKIKFMNYKYICMNMHLYTYTCLSNTEVFECPVFFRDIIGAFFSWTAYNSAGDNSPLKPSSHSIQINVLTDDDQTWRQPVWYFNNPCSWCNAIHMFQYLNIIDKICISSNSWTSWCDYIYLCYFQQWIQESLCLYCCYCSCHLLYVSFFFNWFFFSEHVSLL